MSAVAQILSSAWGQLGINVAFAVGGAFAVFKLLGEKWLEAKFATQLEDNKHAQSKQIEQLKLRINATFDRTVKLYGREFDVLPDVWVKLTTALTCGLGIASRFRTTPDLQQYDEARKTSLFEELKITETERIEIERADNKTNALSDVLFWRSWRKAFDAWCDARDTFDRSIIFIDGDLHDPIQLLLDRIWDVLHEQKFQREHPTRGVDAFQASDRLRSEGKAQCDAIGKTIRAKLLTPATVRDVE